MFAIKEIVRLTEINLSYLICLNGELSVLFLQTLNPKLEKVRP